MQYMDRAVREKRAAAVLMCDAVLMLLMLMGLMGCLLFWLGMCQMKQPHADCQAALIHAVAGTYSLIDWEVPPFTETLDDQGASEGYGATATAPVPSTV